MVFALRAERRRELARETAPIDHIRNVAAVPLAIPLMAGPASITATMLLAGRAGGDPLALAGLMAIVALAIAVVFAVFLAAERFSRWLGATGAVVLSRMLGVVLAALAVQFVIDGVVSVVRAGGG
jgi:multiple antibiotic resistance protein